jgi:hypothetical protein
MNTVDDFECDAGVGEGGGRGSIGEKGPWKNIEAKDFGG